MVQQEVAIAPVHPAPAPLAHHNHFLYWVAQLPPEWRVHLRVVYNTGCRDAGQGPSWLKLGARTYVGHSGDSVDGIDLGSVRRQCRYSREGVESR